MNTQAERIVNMAASLAKAEDIIISRLTTTAWKIAYTALWNGISFSRTEKQKAKAAIRTFLVNNQNIEKAYEEFVQRVLLARHYINWHPGKFVPLPSEWLSEENKMGFQGTQRWMQKMLQKREAIPAYRSHWRDFAWAIWQVSGKKADRYFHQWRSYYAEKDQSMLNLFLATVANNSAYIREEASMQLFALT